MPERPVECSQCKKSTCVVYKEIAEGKMSTLEMCADCPILQQKLHGTKRETSPTSSEKQTTDLYCANCHTPLEAVKMGNPMGCSQCYTIFGELLIQELTTQRRLPKALQEARRNQPLHIGKTPEKPVELPSSTRLTSLNEALNEALQRENYEEAAWLRDQIKKLTEGQDEPT